MISWYIGGRVPAVSFDPLLDDGSVLPTGGDDGNGLVHSGAACSCNHGEDGKDRDKRVDVGHFMPDSNGTPPYPLITRL